MLRYRADGPDPWDAAPEPAQEMRDEDADGTGTYRGRRRRRPSPAKRTATWGTAALVAAVSLVLVGSSVLARSLSEPVTLPVVAPPSPDLSPSPSPTTADGTGGQQPDGTGARQGVPPEPLPAPVEPTEPAAEPTTPPEPTTPDACEVAIDLVRWSDGFRATYTVTNQGGPWDGWTATFQVNDGVTHEFGWDAFFSQQGTTITAVNAPWNGDVDTGETVVFGHRGSRTRRVGISDFAVNGTRCTVP